MTTLDLLAAVVRGDAADWPGTADADAERAFLAAAIDHSVEALVLWRLDQAGSFVRWPATIRAELTRIVREEVLLEVGRQGELRRALSALERAGVPCLVVKGAALAYARYPEPWLRPRNDNDLLIRRDDLDAAHGVFSDLGYNSGNVLLGDVVGHQIPYTKVDAIGLHHAVDLHWKISNRPLLVDLLRFDELLADACAVPPLGDAARAPDDVHALILACVHPVMHHYNTESLLWWYDVHLLASRLDDSGFARFAELACRKGVAAICASVLARTARYYRTPIPQAVMARLSAVNGEPSATYLDAGAWRGDVRLTDFRSMDWRGRLRLVREVALPRREYMLSEFNATSPLLLPALHAYRLTRGTWRLITRFAR
jgi:hypothetical protein